MRCVRVASRFMHCANAFFGAERTLSLLWPDASRFCWRCGAELVHPRDEFSSEDSSFSTSFSSGPKSRCDGCCPEPDERGRQLRDAGISEVYCGWSDQGESAEILRSWKATPGNEASCLAAGRLLGEMLLGQCEDNFLGPSAIPQENVLVPVPGWWGRRLSRGFDPPLRLSEGISEILGWPVWCPLVRVHGKRMARTRGARRREMSRHLFRMLPELTRKAHRGRNLWLVDDLLASGATSAAACRLLRQSSPSRVILVSANVRNRRSGK